ncbi:hypothetical protein [Achromobacter phage shaaii_LB5]|nr:hypothetical protein [Achromobacter phage shaaii_LB5]
MVGVRSITHPLTYARFRRTPENTENTENAL